MTTLVLLVFTDYPSPLKILEQNLQVSSLTVQLCGAQAIFTNNRQASQLLRGLLRLL
jgi:hypothetical protein